MTTVQAGAGRIVVHSTGQETVLSELASSYPLKLLSPRSARVNVRVVYVLTYGGGLVAGDQVDLHVGVYDGTSLVLLTQVGGESPQRACLCHPDSLQGSTKVFKTRPGGRSARPSSMTVDTITSQQMNAVVGPKSALFLLPDPITCFRAARYQQCQTFRLQEESSVVVLDWITSGRKSLGENWSFTKYHSLNEVWVDGERIARDVMLLEDRAEQIHGLSPRTLADRLSPYSCYATVLMYGPLTNNTRRALRERFDNITVFKHAAPPSMIWSYTPIHGGKGSVVRVAATEMETIRIWFRGALETLQDTVGKDIYHNAFG